MSLSRCLESRAAPLTICYVLWKFACFRCLELFRKLSSLTSSKFFAIMIIFGFSLGLGAYEDSSDDYSEDDSEKNDEHDTDWEPDSVLKVF